MFNINYIELFILNTIIYFDLFDFPLTEQEIFQYLYTGGMEGGNYSLLEVAECLQTSENLKKIITPAARGGFYCLKNREEIIKIRLERYNIAAQKYKLALRAIRIFKFLPFLKLAAVCNSLSYFNARKESDIDLFIIASQGRLWLTRLVLIFIITILGLRPPREKAKDKICLSFYVAEDHLDLSDAKMGANDIYFNFWLATLQPVYLREDYFAKLISTNAWLKKYFPNWLPKQTGYRLRVEDSILNKAIYESKEYFLQGKMGDWVEAKTKAWQLKKMAPKKKDIAVLHDTRVIISDNMLKFHANDRRLEYLEKFEKKRKELLDKI